MTREQLFAKAVKELIRAQNVLDRAEKARDRAVTVYLRRKDAAETVERNRRLKEWDN